jgi:hypothetical protein
MTDVTFRTTLRQRRNLMLLTGGLAVAAAAILYLHVTYGGSDPFGRVLGLGLGAAICSLLSGWSLVVYTRAVTECTSAGIRTRGFDGEWRCAWTDVEQIAIRVAEPARGPTTYTVLVTTTHGVSFALGAPVAGGAMPYPDFEETARRIRSYWQRAIGVRPDHVVPLYHAPQVPGPIPAVAMARLLVMLVLAVAIVAIPFTVRAGVPALRVRLGEGQPGSYVAYSSSCPAACYWTGQFTAANGARARDGVTIAPGSGIARIGDRVRAVDAGDSTMVYPAGGGTAWIPTLTLLAIVVVCLPLQVSWRMARRRRRRAVFGLAPPARQKRPDATTRHRWRAVRLPPVAAWSIGVALMLGLSAGGAGIIVAVQAVPPAPSSTARTCADYNAWLLSQHSTALPQQVPAALLRAAQEAPAGPLSTGLAVLTGDLGQAIEQTGTASLADLANVTTDMQVITTACTRQG